MLRLSKYHNLFETLPEGKVISISSPRHGGKTTTLEIMAVDILASNPNFGAGESVGLLCYDAFGFTGLKRKAESRISRTARLKWRMKKNWPSDNLPYTFQDTMAFIDCVPKLLFIDEVDVMADNSYPEIHSVGGRLEAMFHTLKQYAKTNNTTIITAHGFPVSGKGDFFGDHVIHLDMPVGRGEKWCQTMTHTSEDGTVNISTVKHVSHYC